MGTSAVVHERPSGHFPRISLQLICDDVRVENSGKLIIIGLYVDTVVVSELPANLLLTFLQFYQVDEVRPFSVNFQLSGPRGTIGNPVLTEFNIIAPGPVVGIVKIPLRLDSAGQYRITISMPDGTVLTNPNGENTKTFNVILGTQSAAGRTQ